MSAQVLYPLFKPLLFALEPERAHELTLESLRLAYAAGLGVRSVPIHRDDARSWMGIRFPNPVGLAAGLDKDGRYIRPLAALGFGFIEVGTVTPRPQPGNPRPRMFRLPASHALINRMGFNNGGLQAFIRNVTSAHFDGVLGLNIGKNADTPLERAAEDYLICLKGVYPHASYVTINVSSPNTKNLRQLQGSEPLNNLLGLLKDEQGRLAQQHGRYVPLVLKISPDLEPEQTRAIARVALARSIDGLIATNTTVSRDRVQGQPFCAEIGGLSGGPLLETSNDAIRLVRQEVGNAIPIIGVGGILTGRDAQSKIDAGASLIQLYTGLIYRGPGLVTEAIQALRA